MTRCFFEFHCRGGNRGNVVFRCFLSGCRAVRNTQGSTVLPDGKPDFNGVWDHPRVADMTKSETGCGSGATGCKQEGAGELAFTPEGLRRSGRTRRDYDYTARCLPYGYLRGWGSSAPIEDRPDLEPSCAHVRNR